MFDASPENVAHGWKQFVGTPFANFHSGNDWLLIEEVVRKLAWFGAWGLLLGQAVVRSSEYRVGLMIGGVFAVALAVATGLGIEIGQLSQTHHNGEITDVVIYATGALGGLWLRWTWLSDAADRRQNSTYRTSSSIASPNAWIGILQTAIAVGLMIGLFAGLVVLALRR